MKAPRTKSSVVERAIAVIQLSRGRRFESDLVLVFDFWAKNALPRLFCFWQPLRELRQVFSFTKPMFPEVSTHSSLDWSKVAFF